MTVSHVACRICGQKAHGNHFGVPSCRACAAFFRRTATSDWVHKNCRRGGLNRYSCLCKPCRLRRCFEMGMKTENFQYNRDAMLAESTSSITPSISYFVGRPEFLLFCDSGMSTHFTPKNVLDVQYLISEASRLLNQGCESPIFAENQLKKLTIGFNFVRLDTENVKTFEKVGQTEFMDVIEYYFLTTTKWILHFEEFQKLDRSIQMTLVQTIWYVWIKIHKCVSTIAYRKAHPNVCSTYKVLRNHVLDRKKGGLDTSWISDFPEEYVSKYMLSQHMYDFDIMNIIEQLDLSDVELTYMFAQICFEYAGKRFPGEIQNITDHFQQILSNDLHEFYVTDQRRNRYSHRLNELMKVNSLIQKSIWKTRPHRELGRVFGILKVRFSHPEMFEDSGFV